MLTADDLARAQSQILREVRGERRSQDEARSQGRFPFTCAMLNYDHRDKFGTLWSFEVTHAMRFPILVEEVGEAATALMHVEGGGSTHDTKRDLRKELIQVAAVAVAWVEAIDAEAHYDRLASSAVIGGKGLAAGERSVRIEPSPELQMNICPVCRRDFVTEPAKMRAVRIGPAREINSYVCAECIGQLGLYYVDGD